MGLTDYEGVHWIHLASSGSEQEQVSGCGKHDNETQNSIEWEFFRN